MVRLDPLCSALATFMVSAQSICSHSEAHDNIIFAEARGTHLESWNDSKQKGAAETLCINSAVVEYDVAQWEREKTCECKLWIVKSF